jgi:hypothetical protein
MMIGFPVPEIIFITPMDNTVELTPGPEKPVYVGFTLGNGNLYKGNITSITLHQAVIKFTESFPPLQRNQIIPNAILFFPLNRVVHVHLFVVVVLQNQITVKLQYKSDNERQKLVEFVTNYRSRF